MKKMRILFFSILALFIFIGGVFVFLSIQKEKDYQIKLKQEEKLKEEIQNHYGNIVKTTNETVLYKKENNQWIESGSVGENVELTLESYSDEPYFLLSEIPGYYVFYEDVEPILEKNSYNQRYKEYIPFDENVMIGEDTWLYLENEKYMALNEELNLPIWMKDENAYYVEYQDKLLSVLKKDVIETKYHPNSEEEKATQIQVLAYHFIYDPSLGEKCNQIICHTVTQFSSHLEYIRDNDFLSLKMEEVEKFIDGKINLPKKSVVVTVDDGWYTHNAARLLNEYQVNGTIFLVTSQYSKGSLPSEYVEVHSHSHNLHNQGDCSTGQGGGIQCLPRKVLLEDLKKSRESLDNTTVFCYPFYEYNDYSISVLKEAGFTMAFAGRKEEGKTKIEVGINKYKIPRTTIVSTTTLEKFKSIIN